MDFFMDENFFHADQDGFGSSDDEEDPWKRKRTSSIPSPCPFVESESEPTRTESTEPILSEQSMENEVDEKDIEELNKAVYREDTEIGIALKKFHIDSESSDDEDQEVIVKTYEAMNHLKEEIHLNTEECKMDDDYDSDDELHEDMPTMFENLERIFKEKRMKLLVPDKSPYSKDRYWIRTPLFALRELIIAHHQTIVTNKIVYYLPDAESDFHQKTYLVIMNVGAYEGRGQSSLEFLAENAAAADILEKLKLNQDLKIGPYGICPGSRIPREIIGDLKDLCCMYKMTMPEFDLEISNQPVEEAPQFKMICKIGENKLEARSDLISVAKKIVAKSMFQQLTCEPYPDTPVLIGDECLTELSLPKGLSYKERSDSFVENLIREEFEKATDFEDEEMPSKKAKLSPELAKVAEPPKPKLTQYKISCQNFQIVLPGATNGSEATSPSKRPYWKRTVTAPNFDHKRIYVDCSPNQLNLLSSHNLKSHPLSTNLEISSTNGSERIRKQRYKNTLLHLSSVENETFNGQKQKSSSSIPIPPSENMFDPRLKKRLENAPKPSQVEDSSPIQKEFNGLPNNSLSSSEDSPRDKLLNTSFLRDPSQVGKEFSQLNLKKSLPMRNRISTVSVMSKLGPKTRQSQKIQKNEVPLEERRF